MQRIFSDFSSEKKKTGLKQKCNSYKAMKDNWVHWQVIHIITTLMAMAQSPRLVLARSVDTELFHDTDHQ